MGQRVVDGDVQALGHRERDAAVDERDAEPLCEARPDLTPCGPSAADSAMSVISPVGPPHVDDGRAAGADSSQAAR